MKSMKGYFNDLTTTDLIRNTRQAQQLNLLYKNSITAIKQGLLSC